MYLIIPVILLALFLAAKPVWKNRGLSCVILLLTGAFSVFGYLYWGSWFTWKNHVIQLERQQTVKTLLATTQGMETVIERLEKEVLKTPDNPKGWYLLGRLYSSRKDWPKAIEAFQKARNLKPEDVAIHVNYAQALWEKNGRKCNKAIRSIFQEVLKKNPKQPDSLAMLAMDAYALGNNRKAVDYWERLLILLPSESEEALMIRQAIGKASEK